MPTGGGFGLTYAAMNATDVRSELGSALRSSDAGRRHAADLLRGRIAWAHDFVSNPSLSAVFQSLPGIGLRGQWRADAAEFGADVCRRRAAHRRRDWTLIAKFDGEFAPGSQTYAGTGTVRYTW